MAKTVLVVDDDPTQRRLIQAVLERDGFVVAQAENGGEAVDRLTKGAGADVVILDLVMPGLSGMETLAELRAAGSTTPVIVLTASAGVETVVKAMQAGAQDFFVKPASPERILVGVRNALQMGDLKAEVGRLKKRASGRMSFDDLVGDSPPMKLVRRLGERAARANIPVLILGESGVGKEVIARAVHGGSDRAGKPFVAVNCGALPASLVESILFGHEKGSFTGAHDKHLGKFQEANGGTLFLDEVGELPLETQVKLLRALEEGEIQRIGSRITHHVDVRVIAATNRRLADEVAAGRFREDLYYRLNVVHVPIPPLRNRISDLPALARHLLARIAEQPGMRHLSITDDALAVLMRYGWPGNVRQLQNALFRAAVLCDGDALTAADFPQIATEARFGNRIDDYHAKSLVGASQNAAMANGAGITLYSSDGNLRPLEEIEADVIRLAIGHYRGRMTEVARRLGIGRSTLYRKLGELGIGDAAA